MPRWFLYLLGLLCLLAALLVAAKLARAETIAISVSPPLVEMTVAPGGDRSFQVTLTNDGENLFQAKAQVVDLTLDAQGNSVIKPPASSQWSAAGWLDISPTEVSIRPREQKTVRCRVRAPRGQAGGRYAALLFTAQRGTPLAGSGLKLETRTGTVLMLTVAHTERKSAEAGELRVTRDQAGSVVYDVGLRNTGNVHFRAKGELLVRDATGRIAARTKLESGTGTVLPEGVRSFRGLGEAKRFPPGAYTAEARFSAPGLRVPSRQYGFRL